MAGELYFLTAEGGTDATPFTTSLTGASVVATTNFSAADAFHGSMGVRTSAVAGAGIKLPKGSTSSVYSGSIYVNPRTMASGGVRFVCFQSTGSTMIASIRMLTSSGKFDLADTASTSVVSSTKSFTLNSTARVDWQWDASVSGQYTLTAKIFATDSESATPDDTITHVYTSATVFGQFQFGQPGNTGNVLGFDDVRVWDSLLWADPLNPSTPPPPPPPAGEFYYETFDNGTDGNAVTSGGDISAVTPTVIYSAADGVHGSDNSGIPTTVSVVNAFPNPDCVAGGATFGTSNTTVVLGSTDYFASGVGSTKVTVGGSPTNNTFAYPAVASPDTDPVSTGHLRYAAVPGDTVDFLFTVKASASNTAPVNILPKIVGYHWTGTAIAASTSGDANGTAVLLNPGDVAVVAQRITVVTPPTDPTDSILAIPHIRSGTNVASPPAAGSVVYFDRMMLVRNAPRPLTTTDWFSGASTGASWTGGGAANNASSTGSITTTGPAGGQSPYFGTLVTLTNHAAAEVAGGVQMAMLELNWSSYETADGVFSSSYITSIQAKMAAFQAAGMQVTLAMGVHHPPAWALAIANSTQIDQTGATTGQIDTIFNKVIRQKVEAYYTKIDADLGMENFWAVRLTSGGNAEMLHPGGNSYWAFGPNAQNGANMPTTMAPNPFPGWHPGGGDTSITTTQVRTWATWYVNALCDVTNWQMQYFRGLGFTGYFQTLTPGSGRRPSVFTSDVNAYLPNSTTGVGAVWDIYYANLPSRTNVIVYVSSVADGSGTVPDDFTQPGDTALALTDTTMNAWSATRWQTRIAYEYSLPVGGENPGYTTGGAAHYGDTSSAGLMAKSFAQITGCDLFVFYWAHDDRLWDGTSQAFSNYAANIAIAKPSGTRTLGIRTSGATGAGIKISKSTLSNSHTGSIYVIPDTVIATGGAPRVVLMTNSASSFIGSIRLNNANNHFDIGSPTGTVVATGTTTWLTGRTYRLDWQWNGSTSGSYVLTVRVFGTDPEGTTPDETITGTISSALVFSQFIFGQPGNAGSVIGLDSIRVYDTTASWPAPINPGAPPPPPPPGNPGTWNFSWVGGTTATSFSVSTYVTAGTSLACKASTASDMSAVVATVSAVTPDATTGLAKFDMTGLSNNTQYYYQIYDTPTGASESAIGEIGKAKTLKSSGTPQNFNFAFGGCVTNNTDVHAALDDIRLNYQPDFMIHMGDFHYNNPTSTVDTDHINFWKGQIAGATGYHNFIRDVPMFYVRSDHDAGPGDNADSNNASNQASINGYKKIVPYPATGYLADTRSPTVGLYFSFAVGRVRFIFVDIRNMDRSPGLNTDSSSKTMLGATQLAWLKARLIDPEPVKVIVSDVAWSGPYSTSNGEDKWWSYDSERAVISNYIAAHNLQVLMLTSDTHSLLCDNGALNQWGGFPIFGAAPFANVGGGRNLTYYQGVYNTTQTVQGSQYGRVAVTDDGTTIKFVYSGYDVIHATTQITQTINFNVTSPPLMTFSKWDGTTEQPLTVTIWNGTSEVRVNYDFVYDSLASQLPVTNSVINPSAEAGGASFGASSNATVTIGSTDWEGLGVGSAKLSVDPVTVNTSPTTQTYLALPGSFTCVAGNTFDVLATFKAGLNGHDITIVPSLYEYFYDGTTMTGVSKIVSLPSVTIPSGNVVSYAGRGTVVAPTTGTVNGVLILFYILAADGVSAPAVGDVFYTDRLLVVKNSATALPPYSYFDGNTPGAAWSGAPNASVSVRTV